MSGSMHRAQSPRLPGPRSGWRGSPRGQRQLDAVVLKAASPGDTSSPDLSKAANLLIGVVADNQLLLFDPLRGTAVPRTGDDAPVTTDPAGLEAISDDDRWKSGTALVVCHPSAFSPRMLVLQERLEANDSAVLYEELVGGTSEIRPLLDRVSQVTGTVMPAASIANALAPPLTRDPTTARAASAVMRIRVCLSSRARNVAA